MGKKAKNVHVSAKFIINLEQVSFRKGQQTPVNPPFMHPRGYFPFRQDGIAKYKENIVGDTNRLSCEPRGIPQKGLQIACVVAIYVNDVICKLA